MATVRQGIKVFAGLIFVGISARENMRPGAALSPQQNDYMLMPTLRVGRYVDGLWFFSVLSVFSVVSGLF
jgi:hypothetical protein